MATVTYDWELYNYDDVPGVDSPIASATGTTATTYDPSGLPDGRYRFRVKSHRGGGSSPWRYRIVWQLALPDTPTLVAPADGAWIDEGMFPLVDATEGLGGNASASSTIGSYVPADAVDNVAGDNVNSWAANVASAGQYWDIDLGVSRRILQNWIRMRGVGTADIRLQADDNSGFTTAVDVLDKDGVEDLTNYTDDLLGDVEAQYWRVYFDAVSARPGISEIELRYSDGALVWDPAANATSYIVEVTTAADTGFASPLESEEVSVTWYIPTTLMTGNDYIWRVTGKNGTGTGTPSSYRTIHVQNISDTPSISYPDMDRYIQDFRLVYHGLDWTDELTADNYWLQVTTVSGDYSGAEVVVDDDTLTDSEYFPGVGELPPGTYYWHVASGNETGWSAFSSEYTFTVTDPVMDFIAAIADFRVYWHAKDVYASGTITKSVNPYIAEGRDLFTTNGSSGANWSNVGTNTYRHTTGSTSNLAQNSIGAANKAFKLVYQIVNRTAGTLTSLGGVARSTNATFTEYVIAANANLVFTPTSTFDGDVIIQEFKQIDIRPSTDFDMTLGRLNIVSNPDMTFDLVFSGTNWAWSSGGYVHTPGSTNNLAQSTAPTIIGKSYDYEIVISGRTAGSVTVKIGTTGAGSAHSGNGTFTGSAIPAAGTAGVYVTPDSAFDGKIESIKVTPSDDYLLWDGVATAANWAAVTAGTITNPATGVLRIARSASNNPEYAQLAMTAGRRYILVGEHLSDGTAVPAARDNTTTIFTGTTSGSWTPFISAPFTATSSSLRLRSVTSTGSTWAQWRNVQLIEINPLDGVISGATQNSGRPEALGEYSMEFNGSSNYINIYSVELNGIINWDAYWELLVGQIDTADWTAATGVPLALAIDSSNREILVKGNTLAQLNQRRTVGGTSYTNTISTTTNDPWFADQGNDGSANVDTGFNGVTATPVAGADISGNLSSSQAVLGASNTSAANPFKGEIYFFAYIGAAPDSDLREQISQLLETS